MRNVASRRRLMLTATVLLIPVVGCGGDSPVDTPEPLEITIAGVEPDGRYTEPVTVEIETNRGTYEASLDGELFLSGQTVTEVGAHTLSVTARDQGEVKTETFAFEIVFEGQSWLIVRMLDLGDNEAGGGGDAILLTDSAETLQSHVLVDAGPAGLNGSNPGYVAARLQALGVTSLEALILTHAHSDHFDGIPTVLSAIDVERFIYNGQQRSLSYYENMIAQAESRADTVIVPGELLPLPLSGEGGTTITVVPPLPTYIESYDDSEAGWQLNEGSLGTAVTRGAFSMFMTGDGETAANSRWRQSYGELSGNVTVLKVGHHGANDAIFDNGFSGGSAWLNHTAPEITITSANGRTHPRQNAIQKLLGLPATASYCTNVHGDITIRVSPDGALTVSVERNADSDCVAGTDATS